MSIKQRRAQLLEIDPRRIKFNPNNTRKHGGMEYQRLKANMREVGLVQHPIVHVIPGQPGFFRLVDGEGRVQAALDEKVEKLWCVVYEAMSEEDALEMLQAANTVREYDWLAEARGYARLHSRGHSNRALAEQFHFPKIEMDAMIGIGYFPEPILAKIEATDGATNITFRLVREVLPLRQLKPGAKPPTHADTLNGVYDYIEVEKAIDKAINEKLGEDALRSYVSHRRLEIAEEHFEETLQEQLQQELEATKAALVEQQQASIAHMEEQFQERYSAQVASLEQEIAGWEKRYNRLAADVARQPNRQQVIEKAQRELEAQRDRLNEERRKLQALQEQAERERQAIARRAEQEALEAKQRALVELRQQMDQQLDEEKRQLQVQYAQAERDLREYYEDKSKQAQIKAEVTVRDMIAKGVELMGQAEQWLLYIATPDLMRAMELAPRGEYQGLLMQIENLINIASAELDILKYGHVTDSYSTVAGTRLLNGKGQDAHEL